MTAFIASETSEVFAESPDNISSKCKEAVVLGQEVICGLQCTAVALPTVDKVLVVMIDEHGLDSSIVLDGKKANLWSGRFEVMGAAAAHKAAVFALMAEKG